MSFFTDFYESTGFPKLFDDPVLLVKTLIMYVIIGLLFYLAVVKKFEPLLLLPIAFGMLLANLPGANLFHMDFFIHEDGSPINIQYIVENGSLLDFLYLGVKLGIYPSLIFLGVGAMTDFSALIANPKSLLLGAAAQFGVFAAFIGAIFLGFTPEQASAIGIIGGADGPTAILVTKILAPELLGAIAIAAYSYMALIPIIQPPFMKLLTTEKERKIRMTTLRTVTKTEKECGVTERLNKTMQNELMNIVTIFLGVSVGATANADNFLAFSTVKIIFLGLCAFCLSTVGGLLGGKIMCWATKGKVNPLIGSAGVSAVPMAARVSQVVGQKEDPANFLLMHAMGPNVAGVIGSAVAAGVFLSRFA